MNMATKASSAPTQGATFIRTLHARYEANAAEYLRIETSEDVDGIPQERALSASNLEQDVIRATILMQVPDTWPDALVLQYHILVAQQLQNGIIKRDEEAEQRLGIAIDTLFDFMACEIEQDHGESGPVFQQACNRVYSARRLRTGDVAL
jgi:hypothetical protein